MGIGGRLISFGLDDYEKDEQVGMLCSSNNIRKVFVLSPARFRPKLSTAVELEHIEWADIIRYKYFYRLLQEIDGSSLVVVNECLRTQDRHDLTYNCIRHFLNQAGYVLVFQYLPIIDNVDDIMILFDFDTKSRWKREKLRPGLLNDSVIRTVPVRLSLHRVDVPTNGKTKEAYQKEKRRLIDGIGLKDPHTIPRNLHLLSGKSKLPYVTNEPHVGRNNRLGIGNLCTYKEVSEQNPHRLFEFCHNFIDFSDFLTVTRQDHAIALVSDLKVDQWYFQRYQEWLGRLRYAYATLQQG
jgi:hypothetical protein